MHVFGLGGLKGLVVHAAPACVGVSQTTLNRNAASAHRGQHVEHIGFDIALHFKLECFGFGIHRDGFVLTPVFQDALVVVRPKLFEQRPLRGDVWVGIQNQHLGFGFVLLEVMRHLAGTLIRAGRAAVRGFGDADGKHAAIVHGLELFAQGQGLGACFPSMQDLARGIGGLQTFHAVQYQINARREHQLVVANARTAGQGHSFLGRVDAGHIVAHHVHAMVARELVIRGGDVGHGLAATNHQVRDRAGHEG